MSCGLDICYCQSNSIIYNILYCFNTSHVTLYLLQQHCLAILIAGFNTSHVTLYRDYESLQRIAERFQYISCYSLSILPLLLETVEISFNTSHVTLYHSSLLLHIGSPN